jgi:hypothetical protein
LLDVQQPFYQQFLVFFVSVLKTFRIVLDNPLFAFLNRLGIDHIMSKVGRRRIKPQQQLQWCCLWGWGCGDGDVEMWGCGDENVGNGGGKWDQ